MKRIFLALIVCVAAISCAAYSTFAVWSDTVTVTNNQVLTGSADLQVSNVGTSGPWDTSTAASTLTISGLIPGGTAGNGFSYALWNNSSAGVTFAITGQITGDTISGAPGVDETQLEISILPTTSGVPADGDYHTLAQWKAGTYTIGSPLSSGATLGYNVYSRLKSTALNEWQSRTVTFTLTVIGTQP